MMTKDRVVPARMARAPRAMTRRTVVRNAAVALAMLAGGLAAASRGALAQVVRVSKAVAQYQGHPNNGQRCGLCAHYRFPFGCARVRGFVSLHGWCTLYTPRG